MRYLPNGNFEGIWDRLFGLLKEKLRSQEIFESRKKHARRLEDVDRLLDIFLDDEQEPLVDDLPDYDRYLSGQYDEADVLLLGSIGLTDLSDHQMLARVCSDGKNPNGRLRSTPLDGIWHDYFIELIEHFQNSSDSSILDAVSDLPIIPLTDGQTWATISDARKGDIYTPYAIDANDGNIQVLIPENLGLRVLHPIAYQDGNHASFYASLGVSDCPSSELVKAVKQKYARRISDNAQNFLHHLEIFFWCGERSISLLPHSHRSIAIVDQRDRARTHSTVFLPTTQEFDAADLFSNTTFDENPGYGMLHERYLKSSVRNGRPHGLTWEDWLKTQAGIRTYPSLVTTSNGRHLLNPALKAVARDSPLKFVPNLRAHWLASYAAEPWKSIQQDIASTTVPCTDGCSHPIQETLLPCETVLEAEKSLDLHGRLPVLLLPENSMSTGEEQWHFLHHFGVICDCDLDFYLYVLRFVRNKPRDPNLANVCQSIYERIASKAGIVHGEQVKVT